MKNEKNKDWFCDEGLFHLLLGILHTFQINFQPVRLHKMRHLTFICLQFLFAHTSHTMGQAGAFFFLISFTIFSPHQCKHTHKKVYMVICHPNGFQCLNCYLHMHLSKKNQFSQCVRFDSSVDRSPMIATDPMFRDRIQIKQNTLRKHTQKNKNVKKNKILACTRNTRWEGQRELMKLALTYRNI